MTIKCFALLWCGRRGELGNMLPRRKKPMILSWGFYPILLSIVVYFAWLSIVKVNSGNGGLAKPRLKLEPVPQEGNLVFADSEG